MRTQRVQSRPLEVAMALALASALAGAAGCATGRAAPEPDVLEMEPLEFRARREQDRIVVDALDPEVLFEEGADAYKRKRLADAAATFERLVEAFPEHPLALNARFNAGLAREELGELEAALGHYRDYVSVTPLEGDRVDGLLRAAGVLRQLERWRELREVADTLLGLRTNVPDRAHVLALSGLAWQRLGELARAEREFRAVLDLHDEHSELAAFRGNYHVAMAHHQIGEIYHALFSDIRFKLPLDTMERDLDDKSRLFLKAQSAYLKAVRVKNGHWAIASGFRIGAIYEEFYEHFLGADVPPELTEEEVAVYFEELRDKIRPLIQRAIEVYERNAMMSERVGMADSEWARRTRERLQALRALLAEEQKPSS